MDQRKRGPEESGAKLMTVETRYSRRARIKRQKIRKIIRTAFFILASLLVIVAAVLFIAQWDEGEQAAQDAQALLTEWQPSNSPSDDYVQPEAPDVEDISNIDGILSTTLKGYSVIAELDIPKLDLKLPVLSMTSDKALKISVCCYMGSSPGEVGNLVIVGHNYKNGAHFGRLDKMGVGDTIILTGKDGKSYTYTVYKVEDINPDDAEKLDDNQYDKEASLLTCETHGNGRLLVRCRI